MNKRSKKLTAVAWISIILGIFSIISTSGVLILRYANDGGFYLELNYQIVLQFVLSILIVIGGIGILMNKAISQKILAICYGVIVCVLSVLVAKYAMSSQLESYNKIAFIINLLIMLIPSMFCLLVINSKETKSYFNEIKT